MNFDMRNEKKSVMGEIVSVFVLILIVSILAGLTFLFVASLKAQSVDSSTRTTVTVLNESVTFDALNTIQTLSASTKFDVVCNGLTYAANASTTGKSVLVANFTRSGCTLINATALFPMTAANTYWNASYTQYVSYTYDYIAPDDAAAYNAINGTEASGTTLTGYLPLIFLAIIFGAILTLVLKIILPYINLGQNMGGF